MNNEWNSEVVTEESNVDITVDQSYNASSENPQSGTAVAGAIDGVKQLPASTSADATKVLTVNSEGVPGWATAASGGATWTTTQYTSGATVSYGSITIPLDEPLPVKAGTNLFVVEFRAQLANAVSRGLYSIGVTIGAYANCKVPVYIDANSTDVIGRVVMGGIWPSVPSTLPQSINLTVNGSASGEYVTGGFVTTGYVNGKVSLLN